MKKSSILILLACFFISFLGCSGDPVVDKPTQPIDPPWDKSRTAKISFISNLAEISNYNSNNYNFISSVLKSSNSHIQILDNIVVNTGSKNPGAIIASLSGKVPFFVSNSTRNKSYKGSTVCFDNTIKDMELISISDECRFMPISFDIRPGLNVKMILASMSSIIQIEESVAQFKQAISSSSSLIVGTIPKNQFTILENKLKSSLGADTYELDISKTENKNSDYCIYYITSSKWKFRNFTEAKVHDNLKNFIIEVEYML